MADGKVSIKLNVDTSDALKSIDAIIASMETLGKRGTGITTKLLDLKYAFKEIDAGKLTDVNKISLNVEKTMLKLKDAMTAFGSTLNASDFSAFQKQMQPLVNSYKQLEELKTWADLYKEQQDIMKSAHASRVKAEAEQEYWVSEKKRQADESYVRMWEKNEAEKERKQKEFQELLNYTSQAAKTGTPMTAKEEVQYFEDIIGAYKKGTAEYEQILEKKKDAEQRAALDAEKVAKEEAARVQAARQEYIDWWNKTVETQEARASTSSISKAEIDNIKAAISELNKQAINMTPGNMEQTQNYVTRLTDAMRTLSNSEASVVEKERAINFLRGELSNSSSLLASTTATLEARTRAQAEAEERERQAAEAAAKAKEAAAKKAEFLASANKILTLKTNALANAMKRVILHLTAYLSIYRIIGMFKDAVKASSDLIEVQNVVDTTFGDAADAIDEFAKSAVYNLGMSELSAKNFVSSFGSTLKAAGIEENLDGLSIALTQLVGDFASFRNLSFEDSFQKIQSAITGQTRGIRLYGVAVTDANLSNYALELGITKSTKAMTENEKIMLRMSFMLRAMRDSAGDFVKTQDTWANQIRLLSETWKQFLVVLGDTLRIALTGALKWLVSFVQNLVMVMKYIRAFFALLSDASTKFDEFGNIISGKWAAPDYSSFGDGIEQEFGSIEESADDAAEAIDGVLAGYDDVTVLSKSTGASNKSGGLTAADFNLDKLLAEQQAAVSRFESDIEMPTFDISKVEKAVKFYKENVQPIFEWISNHKQEIINAIIGIVTAFLMFRLVQTVYTSIMTVKTGILEVIGLFAKGGFTAIIIAAILAIIAVLVILYATNEDFRESMNKALEVVGEVFSRVLDNLSQVFEYIGGIFDGFIQTLNDLGIEVEDIWDFIAQSVGGILILLGAIAGASIETVVKQISYVIQAFTGLINFITGVFTGNWEKAFDGLKQIVASFISYILSGADAIIGAFNSITGLKLPKPGEVVNNWLTGGSNNKDTVTSGTSKVNSNIPTSGIMSASSNILRNSYVPVGNSNYVTIGKDNYMVGVTAEQKNTNSLLTKLNTSLANASKKTVNIELDGKIIGQSSVDFINGTTIRTGKNPLYGT